MNDIEVINVVNEFYRLKSDYEKTLFNEKITIINNKNLSKEDKLKKYKLFKPKCINCKQEVGTIFTINNKKLMAKCGATKSLFQKNFTPCNLDIQIEKGNVEILTNIINEFHKEKEEDKNDIIKIKLDYFFNFENEENTIKNFKDYKKNYLENMETYTDYLDEFNDAVNSEENKTEIKKTLLDISESKQQIKEYIRMYKEEEKNEYIKEAVEEYVNVLQKLINKYNNLKYKYYTIESQPKKNIDVKNKEADKLQHIYTLHKKAYTTKDIEINIDASYKIISNKK